MVTEMRSRVVRDTQYVTEEVPAGPLTRLGSGGLFGGSRGAGLFGKLKAAGPAGTPAAATRARDPCAATRAARCAPRPAPRPGPCAAR